MDEDCNTDSLRSLAPHWSLAGDAKLLEILQNTHKRILAKCQDVNARLDEMTSALDDASINLQNANNRFMALSNSQFIESRVSEDSSDEHTVEELPPAQDTNTTPQASQTDLVKKSLSILESMHEVVTIVQDSDTESDSDDDNEVRVVLKPKDLYRERPLPYIIGSEPWKNKWHAGLQVEDSDSDSCGEKSRGHTPEYSDTDEEPASPRKQEIAVDEDEAVPTPPVPATPEAAEMTPSDMAAELARRLTAQAPPIPELEEEYYPPRTAVKTVYKPQQPPTGVVFSEEPPPLERYDSESSEEDIFAELHKSQPYSKNETVRSTFTDDLFGVTVGEDLFTDTNNTHVSQPKTVPEPSSYLRGSNSETVERNDASMKQEVPDEKAKRPVGGISVFGSVQNAGSISAAILKRNIRKQSSSGDESDRSEQPPLPVQNTDHTDSAKKEKDILKDLFAKPKNDGKKGKNIAAKSNTDNSKDIKKDTGEVDLLSDNIFDDIDDIFSSNIVKVPKKDRQVNKDSIFDDDIDLFADISNVAPAKVENTVPSVEKKGLFDSDDDLFTNKSSKINNVSSITESQNDTLVSAENLISSKKFEAKDDNIVNVLDNNVVINKHTTETSEIKVHRDPIRETMTAKSIFDSDSDTDIFSSVAPSKSKIDNRIKTNETDERDIKIFTPDTHSKLNVIIDTVTPKAETEKPENIAKISDEIKAFKSPSLFDEDDCLFTTSNTITSHIIKEDTKNEEIGSEIDKKSDTINAERIILDKNSTHLPTTATNEVQNNISERSSENLSRVFKEKTMVNTSQVTSTVSDNVTTDNLQVDLTEGKTKIQSINNNANTVLLSEDYNPIHDKDTFGEILHEPPAFEKAKESKKSKNVNALFDDDSNDETLFFRKSDVIDDVQEDYSSKTNQDAVFGLFHDEPPAIDIDFGEHINATDENKLISDTNIFRSDPGKHNIFEKRVADVNTISEAPTYTPELTIENFDNNKNDIFSSIYSHNIFKPTEETEVVDKAKVGERNKFDDLFNSPNNEVHVSSNITDQGVLSISEIGSLRDRGLYEQTGKIRGTQQVAELESTTDTDKLENTDGLFSSSKSSLKSTQIFPSPLESDLDNSDEELFKSTSNESQKTVLISPDPKVEVFDDSSSEINKNVVTEKVASKSIKENESLINVPKRDEKIENVSDSLNKDAITSNKGATKSDTTNLEQKIETEDDVDQGPKRQSDVKTIGKLKAMNFNINVATLLPGASPKKQNRLQNVTTKSFEEVVNVDSEVKTPDKTESTIAKSISFGGEPNSDVLDNTLSKERAKIQVKRRPSTRRARREAVRKSVLNLEDSTDNSSSIDDPPKGKTEPESKTGPVILTKKAEENTGKSADFVKKQEPTVTRVVYVLNDDDIFNAQPKSATVNSNNMPKNEENTLGGQREGLDFTDGIKTIGKVYKNVLLDNPESTNVKKAMKSSLFSDQSDNDDDDALFNRNKKPISKPNIFDSGSEEELFTGRKKEKQKKVVVKPSLFGDDDVGDDLFAGKTSQNTDSKTAVPKPQASRELPKSTEPVFDDPLSLLGSDGDE